MCVFFKSGGIYLMPLIKCDFTMIHDNEYKSDEERGEWLYFLQE